MICVQAVRLLQLRDISRNSPTTLAKGLVPPEWLEVLGKILQRPRPIQTIRDFLPHRRQPRWFPGTKIRRRTGLDDNLARTRYAALQTFSDFDTGGKLTEIGLAGVVGLRAGKSLDWDGEKVEAKNAPEAARFVHTEYRTKWLT